jgi:anaerobic magnesium-protoporphyrin IX monomethyl ester cyclase
LDVNGAWLLLDPPSGGGYSRRASLREKQNAPKAPFPSIDLVLLSGAIREAGYVPTFLDAQVRRMSWDSCLHHLGGMNVHGFVSLVSSNCMDEELDGLRAAKRALGDVPLFLVGSIHLVLNPGRVTGLLEKHPHVNGVILNTAENNLADLWRGADGPPVNVALRRHSDIVAPASKVTYGEGLRIPPPDHSIFMDRRYFFPQSKRTPVTCVQTSFGCPYTCEFCLDNALYRKMSYRDPSDCVNEMVEIDRLGFREAYVKDLTFGLNKRVATEFLEQLAARRLALSWLCTTRVDVASPRLLEQMKKAGCYGIEFGVESGLRHRREANGKRIEDEEIRDVFQRCRRLGLETTAFVMIGFEDETEEEIATTIRFIESLDPDYASYNVVNALPGTILSQRASKEGFLREGAGDLGFLGSNLRHRFLPPGRVDRLRGEAMRSFYGRPAPALRRLLKTRSWFEFRKLVRMSREALAIR